MLSVKPNRPADHISTCPGVRDTLRFSECNAAKGPLPRVDRGLEVGRKIGVRGTPTVIVNRWLLPTPPRDTEEYVRVIRAVLAGEEPYAP